jgi:hypothetical protein
VKGPETESLSHRPRLSPAQRAGTIVYLVLLVPATLLLAVVTLLLVVGLILDFGEFAHQIPVILLSLMCTAGGGLSTHLNLRRLIRGRSKQSP